jgi:hypothetical protein
MNKLLIFNEVRGCLSKMKLIYGKTLAALHN